MLIHSDRGSQYRSADFKHSLLQYGLRQSMSRRGNCFDNAVIESFFIHSKSILFITVTTKRGSWLIKHYLYILKSIIIVYAVIQPTARYRLNNNITETTNRNIWEYRAIKPCPLKDDLAGTFAGGRYKEIVFEQNTVLFRAGMVNGG
ncbi:DDE-type integrase/transposase/recombinase [Gilliamella sp. Pas-s25]|nr:DDE-type integrase/transposase/recombinase [Gilliamella sp. Pas-s25]